MHPGPPRKSSVAPGSIGHTDHVHMIDEPGKTLADLVAHVGRFPEEAFLFVRDGLSYASDRIHGPETESHRLLQHYLGQQDLDWNDLIALYHTGELPEPVVDAIDAAGGCEKLNRHVSGRELCWALRDYALRDWFKRRRAGIWTLVRCVNHVAPRLCGRT